MIAGPGINDPAGLPTTCWVSPHLTCSAIFVKVHRRDPVGAGDGSAWIPRLLTRQINVTARHRQLDNPLGCSSARASSPGSRCTTRENVALTNVKLTAGQGTANCTAATLAPGANVVCKNNAIPRHTVTTADMLAGEWKETYTASATAAGSTVQASAELFPVDLREVSIDDEALVWVPSGAFDSSSLVRVPQAGGTGTAVVLHRDAPPLWRVGRLADVASLLVATAAKFPKIVSHTCSILTRFPVNSIHGTATKPEPTRDRRRPARCCPRSPLRHLSR